MTGGILDIASEVRTGARSAAEILDRVLAGVGAQNPALNAITRRLDDRARAAADRVDAKVRAGSDPGPLAGVPFGVKDLFDVAGLPTTAGAGMRRDAAPAIGDAAAVRRLSAAGAVLVATLNMDEYAYGFATDNAVWGVTRNPHDLDRLAGGSSGGSAAAVASGMLPLALGSDTNGSIRVPASLCGVYGLKPTHGGLPMAGVFPFVDSFDDIGPFARSVAELKLAYEVLAGASLPTTEPSRRVAVLGGWFARDLAPALQHRLEALRVALGAATVELAHADCARSAAFLMTAAEGGARHLPALRTHALAFDPATRDRLIAGAAFPRAAYDDALRFQAWFRKQALAVFERYDVLIAPSTSGPAPRIDTPFIEIDGKPVSARANLGRYTQPISFVGLPVIAAPLRTGEALPLGVQLIGAPGREAELFALAHKLERDGLIGVTAPAQTWSAPA